MGLLALFALVAIVVGGGKKSAPKSPTPVDSSVSNNTGDKSVVSAPQTDPIQTKETKPVISKVKPGTFADLGSTLGSGSVLSLNSVEPEKKDWPGIRSLPDAWQRGALNLLATLPYAMAMGHTPLSISTSANPDRLYNFARELEAARVSGFGTNVALALKELIVAARTLERVRGYESPYRWEGAYL